jgi:low temperature requirement protein LtrA
MCISLVTDIIVSAVADELILKHPAGHADTARVTVIIGGPVLYLTGNLLFKWLTAGWPPLSHLRCSLLRNENASRTAGGQVSCSDFNSCCVSTCISVTLLS